MDGLIVLEAYASDVGRGIARISQKTMTDLVLKEGNVVEIVGKRRTVARCLLLHDDSQKKESFVLEQSRKTLNTKHGLKTKFQYPRTYKVDAAVGKKIRIDGLIRNNASIAIGDTITVKKIDAPEAKKISIMALENIPPIDPRYVADALATVPVSKGDNVMVPYFGGRLTFAVMGLWPDADAVVVVQKTEVLMTNRPTMVTMVSVHHTNPDDSFVSFVIVETVEKKNKEKYLVLGLTVSFAGFSDSGRFELLLQKNADLQHLVSKYRDTAQDIVRRQNEKNLSSEPRSANELVKSTKFAILQAWMEMRA